MQTPAAQKWLPSHLAVNSARVAIGKEMVRARSAIGKEMVNKHQQRQNGSPHILLSILLVWHLVRKW